MNDLPIYMAIATFVLGMIYFKVSKFFGSMGIFLLGMGLLYRVGDDGWIGMIVMACGFLMIIYSVLDDGKGKRYIRRR